MNELSIEKLEMIKKGLKFYLELLLIMDEKEFSANIVDAYSPALPNTIKNTREFIHDTETLINRKKLLATY